MKILTQRDRHSERIIRKIAADILNIPETDDDQKIAMDESAKCAKCGVEMVEGKCAKCAKEASETDESVTASKCPRCDNPMQVIANIERCVCGYGQSAKKKAEDTGVGEYYRKLYPDAYVSEMTGDPKSICDDKEVSYEMKPNTEVKVSARDIIQRKRIKRKMHGANELPECTVPDAHPESGVSEGSGAEQTPDPKWQSGESANSVTGPEKAKSHGPGLQDPGSVAAPDLGLPRGASKKCKCGGSKGENQVLCSKCFNKKMGAKEHPFWGKQKSKEEDGKDGHPFWGKPKSKEGREWITREVMAVLCPPCAEEMARRGITRVKASTIAKLVAQRADETGFAVKEGAAPGKKDPKGVGRAPKAPKATNILEEMAKCGFYPKEGHEKEAIEELATLVKKAVSPPGWKGTVEHMKEHKDIETPWALAWWMKGEGYKPHKKSK